jgi:hypothetical protein
MAPQGKQRKRLEAREDQYGSVFSVSGPVVVAENMIGCAMYELVSLPDLPLDLPRHPKTLLLTSIVV